ncbi:hypothetical protein HPP92_014435 [Vanilla planifolia]|uniref:WRKY domain-containing protein n=1 Tax=Vanilla planifolia TaxID=51239 RepID=A0A835QRJ3_VANPL|nr:hypothetical protein HPP92_014435 [Vanilla planifolia]
MCDYFWQRMENSQGDLTDIFRSPGEFPVAPSDAWQPLPDPPVGFASFGDPFADIGDPLLRELPPTSFFDSPETAVGASVASPRIPPGAEDRRPSGSLFSRMLQISPVVTGKESPAAGPSPLLATVDGVPNSSPRMPGMKRRKGQAKKVVCVPAPAAATGKPGGEVVPSDLWAWRKYGQKPIKGSPYPRGYYRCSSSKGCSARKQVERSRTDPNMLVITYTSEHNHAWPTQRNALAGSTRSQPSKGGTSSASKSSPRNQKQAINSKEEPKECSGSSIPTVKEEVLVDFEQVFDESFHEQMMSELNQQDDFFADLTELEPDPMNLVFPKGLMEDNKLEEERKGRETGQWSLSVCWNGVKGTHLDKQREVYDKTLKQRAFFMQEVVLLFV